MNEVFADAWFFIALLDERDSNHKRVSEYSQNNDHPLVTTRWILAEVGAALADSPNRAEVATFLAGAGIDDDMEVVTDSDEWYDRGLALFVKRPDKQWSLADCASFALMDERCIQQALTGDKHFRQAGFTAIFAVLSS